jgi:hypothetical protein
MELMWVSSFLTSLRDPLLQRSSRLTSGHILPDWKFGIAIVGRQFVFAIAHGDFVHDGSLIHLPASPRVSLIN